MILKKFFIIIPAVALLAACTPPPSVKDAQYWQRSDASSSIWMRGPKAQQRLYKDITSCTSEINEAQRLDPLRRAMPSDGGHDPYSPQGRLAEWDTPERDGALLTEHSDYHDFEGCMTAKGWERVQQLPYEQAQRARSEWIENVGGHAYQSKHAKKVLERQNQRPTQYRHGDDDFDHLNE